MSDRRLPPTQRPQQRKRSLAKEVCMQAVAGGCAGGVEVALMHPLDVIKTRFQLPDNKYRGVIHCARQMSRKEGFFSFWKGVWPPILVQTPKRAYKFLCFEQCRKVMDRCAK